MILYFMYLYCTLQEMMIFVRKQIRIFLSKIKPKINVRSDFKILGHGE